MKKFILMLAVAFSVSLFSCTNEAATEENKDAAATEATEQTAECTECNKEEAAPAAEEAAPAEPAK